MNEKRSQQITVFSLTWISYAALYCTRKNFSVVKSALFNDGISIAGLGLIDTCYLSVYAAGQFLSGYLGDRFGARFIIVMGLIGSGVASLIFSYGQSVMMFAIVFGINGLFQSTGWSNNIKALEPWFAKEHRGKILGLWGTNQQVGGLLATILSAFLLAHFGWQSAFLVPASLVIVIGIIVFIFLFDGRDKKKTTVSTHNQNYWEVMQNPYLWCLSLSYFGVKLIRYSLLFWLPFYLHHELNIDVGSAGYLSVLFEIGGIFGSVGAGILADKYFESARIKIVFPLIISLSMILYLYEQYANQGTYMNCALMFMVGLCIAGPDSLMSGACAQDFGGKHRTGSVAGFINGVGSMGAILQGLIVAYVSEHYGWSNVFYLFFIIAGVSAILLIPFIGVRRPRYAAT
jgi:sugar phosphate permease